MTSEAQGRLPNFFIIGAPKAGTTTLSEYLSAHPDAYVPPQKELYFFLGRWGNGVDWYREQYRRAGAASALGDATPTYMYSDEALARMRETVPDARLVAILRDPVGRAYSDYWYLRQLGEKRSFQDAIRQEMRDGKTELRRVVGYVEAGRYLPHLVRVTEHFPRESLLVLLMDDLQRDPASTHATLCTHLGLDASRGPGGVERANSAYRLRWPALRRLVLRYRLMRRAPWLGKRLEAINRAPLGYPPMDPGMRAELKAWYAKDNAGLAEWLGRDLSAWT